jgi:thiol-disulfide isomerase/thioredoxin
LKESLVVAAAFLLLASGCGPAAVQKDEPAYAVGIVARSYLDNPAWPEFRAVFDTTQVEREFIEMIRASNEGEAFLVFFGAWCSDSKRDLPRFLKIADEAGISPSAITLYSLDRTKKSADGMTARYGIEFVPTFIVLKDSAEVGRITEFPRVSVEADLLEILAAARGK